MELVSPVLGFPHPGSSSSRRGSQVPPHFPKTLTFKIPFHPENTASTLPHSVVPNTAHLPLLHPVPLVPIWGRGCPSVLCSQLTSHGVQAPSSQASPSSIPTLIAIIIFFINVPNPVNRVSFLPCCDVSNLSALILAWPLSTSFCPPIPPPPVSHLTLLPCSLPLSSLSLVSVSLSLCVCGLSLCLSLSPILLCCFLSVSFCLPFSPFSPASSSHHVGCPSHQPPER